MRIVWRRQAQSDLNEITGYLLKRNPPAALDMHRSIRGRVGLLADYPGLGRPGRVAGTRELVIPGTPYVLAYTADVDKQQVVILRVLHGARLWPEEP